MNHFHQKIAWENAVPGLWALILAVLCVGCDSAVDEAAVSEPVVPAQVSNDVQLELAPNGRVIILGFDGVDPNLVAEMMDKGELPNLKKLSEKGSFKKLATTTPPHSPVAWSSFSTSTSPRKHDIHSFFTRDPKHMALKEGVGYMKRPELDDDGAVEEMAHRVNYMRGKTFWSVADAQGIRTKVLNVPFMTPPDKLEFGKQLCGLGVKDIRLSNNYSYLISDEITERKKFSGGIKIPIKFDANFGKVFLPGHARLSKVRGNFPTPFLPLKLELEVDRTKNLVEIRHPEKDFTLPVGEWSEWIPFAFRPTENWTVDTMSRFFLMEAGEHFRLYMSCFQYDPYKPYAWFTHPPEFSAELADRYGLFKTIGWSFDTNALEASTLSEEAFLLDVKETMNWRERLTLDEMEKGDFDLLVSAWTATDRVGHMFWKHRDPGHPGYTVDGHQEFGRAVEDTYIRMDEIVGEVMGRLEERDLLMILSDHGMDSWRMGFDIAKWLRQNGYAVVKDREFLLKNAKKLLPMDVYDWKKTRAFFLGLNSIYLNVEGRERDGIVPSAEADALAREIRDKLMHLKNPLTREPVFKNIHLREDFAEPNAEMAPDIFLGYQGMLQSSKGGKGEKDARPGLFAPVRTKWSGDHAGSDASERPGIFFSNRQVSVSDPDIRDLGATALVYLDALVPAESEGRILIQF